MKKMFNLETRLQQKKWDKHSASAPATHKTKTTSNNK